MRGNNHFGQFSPNATSSCSSQEVIFSRGLFFRLPKYLFRIYLFPSAEGHISDVFAIQCSRRPLRPHFLESAVAPCFRCSMMLVTYAEINSHQIQKLTSLCKERIKKNHTELGMQSRSKAKNCMILQSLLHSRCLWL